MRVFEFPFLAQGALAVWQNSVDVGVLGQEKHIEETRQTLAEFTRRSLLETEGQFQDGSPAAYRFQPALLQAVAAQAEEAAKEPRRKGLAAYGAWLAQLGYGKIHQEGGTWLNRLVRLSLPALFAAAERLKGSQRLAHIKALAWVLGQFGETQRAYRLLVASIADTPPEAETHPEEARADSSLRYELAMLEETRGDLKRALALYEESLTIREQVGDLQGKGATLSGMANVYMAQNHWEQAAELVQQAVEIGKRMGDAERIAFDTTKLDQIAQASGDDETALVRYKDGLKQFERLGMQREIQQVQNMIAQLQGGAPPAPADPLAQAVAQARSAARAGDLPAAIQAQEQAVALVRERGQDDDTLVVLSIQLHNLAGYYAEADRHDDAVQAFEEVVSLLDQGHAHPELEGDRQILQAARQMAALSPEEREQLRQNAPPGQDLPEELRRQLESLSPQERAQFEAAAAEFAARLQEISPAERQQIEIEALLGQVGAAAAAVRKGEAPLEAVLPQIEQAANRAAEGEEPGSPWDEAARYLRAVAAVLKGETLPPVPEAYAANLAALLEIDEPREGDKQDDRG